MPYWQLYYHFIWGTKNRLQLIDSAQDLYRAIAAKTQVLGGFVHAVGGWKIMCISPFLFHPRSRLQNSLVMLKVVALITSIMSSSLISNFTGRMNMGSCLLAREILLR